MMSDEFLTWVGTIGHALGLYEWEIRVEYDADLPDDVFARCDTPRARQAAEITLGPQFDKSSPEEKRATIVHELLHCHFAQIVEVSDETLPPLLGKPTFHVFETAHELAMERCLDAIAVAWATLLPLPPEGK